MKRKTFLHLTVFMLAVIITAVLFGISSFAAVSAVDGVIIGLDPDANYEIASVTVANYQTPSYSAVKSGTTKIDGLSAGIYYVNNTTTGKLTAVWVEGDAKARNDIGVLVEQNTGKWLNVNRNSQDFIDGTWTGTETANLNSTYYMTATSNKHISRYTAAKAYFGKINTKNLLFSFNNIYFRYAYLPEQIIPVDELVTMGFHLGKRQGSINIESTVGLKSKYVLWTMDESGAVKSYAATLPADYSIKNTQSVNIANCFPDAEGWIIGIDVYPFASFTAQNTRYMTVSYSFSNGFNEKLVSNIEWKDEWTTNETLGYNEIGSKFVNTCLYLEYIPEAYVTVNELKNTNELFKYNGANTAYIQGYANGNFAPEANITRAETVAILSRLIENNFEISYSTSSFIDCTTSDWFFKDVAYLESLGLLSYLNSSRFYPNEEISRGEVAQLINSIFKYESSNSCFDDVDETNKFYSAIIALADKNILNGYSDGTFRPNANITRAELVTVINRAFNLIANEDTVDMRSIKKTFNDISEHWAEYQILMAANDNVFSSNYYSLGESPLSETATQISFENQHIKVVINKSGAVIDEIINKATGKNIVAPSVSPWFSYLTENRVNVSPISAEIENGRLKLSYSNGIKIYCIIEVHDNYFSVELDSNVPNTITDIIFCNLSVNSPWELDNPDAYGLSAIPMTTTVNIDYYPGGSAKIAKAKAYSYLGVDTIGSKVGVAFSNMNDHRQHLKCITDNIDPDKGITSTFGGAYTYDNPDIYGDYVITSGNLTIQNATQTAELLKEYSVNEIHIHQGGSTFIQGDFNFVCARTDPEKKEGKFIDADTFKKRIGQEFIDKGVYLGLHTYSSLVSPSATSILVNPQYQQDIIKHEVVWTLKNDITASQTTINTKEDASSLNVSSTFIPYGSTFTNHFLVDEEIIKVVSSSVDGFTSVSRGQCGTSKAAHKADTKVYQLAGYYGGFQPKPLSNLFYKVAELTAKAYNEGSFETIYLDGLESFARKDYIDTTISFYAYAEFVRAIVSACEDDPLIEFSTMQPCLWAARGRGGAIDHPRRAYKPHMTLHINSQSKYLNYFYTATAGWFNYCPDKDSQYKDTVIRSLYRDDMDQMGSLALAYNFGTVTQYFTLTSVNDNTRIGPNFMYYGLYSRLRKGNYFAPEVKKQIIDGEYEYKIIKLDDGSWAFKEMSYKKHKIHDLSESFFTTISSNNTFDAQTPFIRIENRYTAPNNADDSVLIYNFDETVLAKDLIGSYSIPVTNAKNKYALKLRVCGNNSSDALLISLDGVDKSDYSGRYDYFVPLNFEGWRDIVLVEANNEDYDGYSFPNIKVGGTTGNVSYRRLVDFEKLNLVQVSYSGDCEGVYIDTLTAFTPADAPVTNPSITINGETITFNAELHSSDYIEYYPEYNKAYLNYYTQIYNTNGTWKDDEAHTKEITFTGSVTAPSGNFVFSYSATPSTDLVSRAQVVFGFGGKIIKNPDDWTAPEIDMPTDIEKVALF